MLYVLAMNISVHSLFLSISESDSNRGWLYVLAMGISVYSFFFLISEVECNLWPAICSGWEYFCPLSLVNIGDTQQSMTG